MEMLNGFANVLKTYPAMSAALVNIGVVVLTYFGFHVTPEQLIYIVGVVTALFGVIVHSNVTPVSKIVNAEPGVANQPPPMVPENDPYNTPTLTAMHRPSSFPAEVRGKDR